MKAVTLWQPWASLVAIGAKTIETRSWATSYRGPLAIHAAARKPAVPDPHGWIGRYNLGEWADPVQHAEPCDCDHDEEQLGARCAKASNAQPALLADEGAHGFSLATVLPLGAVVATCTLADVVPIHALTLDKAPPMVFTDAAGHLLLWRTSAQQQADEPAGVHWGGEWAEVDEQRPYGDFAPGRYAWVLEDVQALPEPVPARGRQQLWDWPAGESLVTPG